ncbi:ESX-1 secretion-associated protein [Mycobacterium sp. SMC-16]|uniref:ESX-1 secretion-associated protein n=1 Tax=Mycobacterium sp. SMC-16 TaxID=3385967 RepID=UPI00390C6F82
MSSRLTVETSELQALSTKQDDAAATFSAAGDTTSYVEVKVLATHGPLCMSTQSALSAANNARKAACEQMMNKSRNLADNLTKAASQYDQTDAQEGAHLSKQMQI